MKISKGRLIKIIKEELDYLSDEEKTVDDLSYELEFLIGRKPTEEEIDRIRSAVLKGDIPIRGKNE
tara:strand:- start:67 stop:264 length:198 start_codon:yes stop_codon:yes gene_type:complete